MVLDERYVTPCGETEKPAHPTGMKRHLVFGDQFAIEEELLELWKDWLVVINHLSYIYRQFVFGL